MSKEQALELIMRAISQYRGTLEDHQMLQEAILVIQNELGIKTPTPASTKSTSKKS